MKRRPATSRCRSALLIVLFRFAEFFCSTDKRLRLLKQLFRETVCRGRHQRIKRNAEGFSYMIHHD